MYKNNLKDLRENDELNKIKKQKEIAEKFDINYSTYNDWEREKNMIPIETADKFALYYKVSLSTVLGYNHNIDEHVNLKPLDYNKLIDNLQKLKKRSGKTYEYIGKKTHSTKNIQKYFTNKRKINANILHELSNFFEVDIDSLCGKKDLFIDDNIENNSSDKL